MGGNVSQSMFSVISSSSLSYLRSFIIYIRKALLLPWFRLCLPVAAYIKQCFLRVGLALRLVSEKYVYTRLETTDHIRVIELLPSSSEDDRVCCRIHHSSHAKPILSYTAISYVWGDDREEVKIDISCDGRRARIPPNLHSALIRLRDPQISKFLWADAICIDQNPNAEGLAEKEQQVRMMDRTFSRAECVIIDLGDIPATDVLEMLDRFFDIPDEKWEQGCHIAQSQNFKSGFQFFAPYDLPGVGNAFWQAFATFMQRPWFTRVWIIQEYTLATKATFLIGKDMRPGTFLPKSILRPLQYMVWLYHYDRLAPVQEEHHHKFASAVWDLDLPHTAALLIQEAKDSRPRGLPLSTLLWRTKRFKATNPRDKVYAIFGLVTNPKIQERIPIDYKSKDIHPVGVQVARYLIDSDEGPYVLYNCRGIGNADGLDSWEMQLTEPNADNLAELYRPTGVLDHDVYSACGRTRFRHRWISGNNSTSISSSDSSRPSLLVGGCIVGRIASLSPALPYPNTIKHADVSAQSTWLIDAFEWMTSVYQQNQPHLHQPNPSQSQSQPSSSSSVPSPGLFQFTMQCWTSAICDLMIPPSEQGRGYVRTSRVPTARKSLEAVDNSARYGFHERRSTQDSFLSTMKLDDSFVAYANAVSESFRFAFGRRLGLLMIGDGEGGTAEMTTCTVPREAQESDVVCVVLGCPMPFVLRPVMSAAGEGGGGGSANGGQQQQQDQHKLGGAGVYYRIVGSCYVHGMMDGEALKAGFWREEEIEIR